MFVTLSSSNIRSLEQAQGTRLGLPHADSLPTYLAQGEANAVGIQIKSYFKRVSYSRYQDSALFALGIQQQDVAAVDVEVAKKWLAQNAGVIIAETPAVPNLSVAINSKMVSAVQQDKIRAALLRLHIAPQAALLQRLKTSKFEPAGRDDFTYVATLGYFTPKILPGVGVINADQAKALMGQGVPLFDVRTEHEYKRSHIQHAINLPYLEKSAKAVDFDAALDVFDITRLPREKTAPMIFACNGAECWKSYKSAKLALAHKYTRVYWYRDGYPEWLARSYPVE